MITSIKAVAICMLVCSISRAQHEYSQMASNEKPIALYPGLGTWTHPIATRSPEAQKYFDQGLTLMYGFDRYEARRSFRKALELDATAAMAQWGMAMALGPYLNMDFNPDVHVKESCDAVDAGLAIREATVTERAWLEAAAARCPDYSQPQKYVAAMRALATRFPDDPDAQTLFAESLMVPVRWHFYPPAGKPAEGIEEAQRVLEAVLRHHPNHPGANHFYIHAIESSPTLERAIPSAQRLMGIVPAAGHMVHMPGHIWLVLGDYDTAVAVNERSAQVLRDNFAKTGVSSSYYMDYLHALGFILYSRSMQGHLVETRTAINAIRESLAPIGRSMPQMASGWTCT
jgi:tetratricopeptide (TPR) repeat protein